MQFFYATLCLLATSLLIQMHSVLSAGVPVLALLPTPVVDKGVPRTAPPENEIHSSQYATPVYKDYYSKTAVVITPVVSTVLYQEMLYETPLNETWERSTVLYSTVRNTTLGVSTPAFVPTVLPSRTYETYEWPTETQIYTTAINATTTRVVENTILFP
ncbi:uncharacterized protein LOC108666643 [Hyalella azteca]|uniref:Uncharacterized protein LOC108666643 n=1 Tax=Hyalella azteca TaxID=294128 RepID=A0A8B7N6Y5_HYAAZ|nr:uncharacterized protein LOC108666643 [Hyalella azteca]